MSKQIVAVILAVLLAGFLPLKSAHAASLNSVKEVERAAKIKASLAKSGTGEQARVTVKLRDKTKVTGYISALGEDTFAVTAVKTGVVTAVPYPAVAQVQGHNLTTGAKIAIGALIGAAIVVALVVAKRCGNEGGC